MSIPESFYTTRVLLEVTVRHQFTPRDGIQIVKMRLSPFGNPVVEEVKVISAESNYLEPHAVPTEDFRAVTELE